MDADERIQDEEGGAVSGDRGGKSILIVGAIEAESVGGDDSHVEVLEIECVHPGQSLEAGTHGSSRVFGSIEQHGAGSAN